MKTSSRRITRSFGVACCRVHKGTPEVLIVRKRISYAYAQFVRGHYDGKRSNLLRLFGKMTVEDKCAVGSLSFAHIWYRWSLGRVPAGHSFFVAKMKFESTFLADGGHSLRSLLAGSGNCREVWEIPKGKRRNKAETGLSAAMREFYEETGVARQDYRLIPCAARECSYIDDGATYQSVYFVGMVARIFEPTVNFARTEQSREISDIRWAGIETARALDPTNRLANMIKPILGIANKAHKNKLFDQ